MLEYVVLMIRPKCKVPSLVHYIMGISKCEQGKHLGKSSKLFHHTLRKLKGVHKGQPTLHNRYKCARNEDFSDPWEVNNVWTFQVLHGIVNILDLSNFCKKYTFAAFTFVVFFNQVWSAQCPNTGQNIQHTSHVQNSLLGVRSSGFSLLVSLITWWTRWSRSCLEDPTTRRPGANLTWKQFNKIIYTCKTHG